MTGELAPAVVSGAVERAVETPVLFFPLELTVAVCAPTRKREKTFVETHQKKHFLAEGRDRTDLKVIHLPAVHLAGARPDDLRRFGTVRLDLITMAVRIVDIHASFAHRPELFPAILDAVTEGFHSFLRAPVLLNSQQPRVMDAVAIRTKRLDLRDLDQEHHLAGVGLEKRVGPILVYEISPDHVESEDFLIELFRTIQVRYLNHKVAKAIDERHLFFSQREIVSQIVISRPFGLAQDKLREKSF